MKKRKGLTLKFVVGLLLFSVVLVISAILVGVKVYRSETINVYTTMAYQIAETAKGYFTEQELSDWPVLAYQSSKGEVDEAALAEVMESARYQEVQKLLDDLRSSTKANDIYVYYLDEDVLNDFSQELYDKYEWNPMCYVMDSYIIEDKRYKLGDVGAISAEFLDPIREAVATGKAPEEPLLVKGSFGYNTTAVLPVTKDGKTIVCIGVEIPVATLQSSINQYISRVVLISVIVAVVLMVIICMFLLKILINPIKLVAKEANRFVENNNEISKDLEKIKSKDEIGMLSESLLKLENDVNEYIKNITYITAEKERIGAELNVATQIQADMLPSIFPAFPERKEFDIYATMNPAKEVGGDFYDFFLVDDDHLALVMADVSGKGVPAALFMVIAKTLIKNRTQMGGTPSEILAAVNEQLCEGNEAGLFVTVWLAILEISTGKGIAANAGHEYPAVRRKDGSFELIKNRHSPAVATIEGIRFRQNEFQLFPGDRLYVYTDGVPEATNGKNELFDTDRMLDSLNKRKNESLENLMHGMKEDIDLFVGDAPQFDDITMLSFDYFGGQQA